MPSLQVEMRPLLVRAGKLEDTFPAGYQVRTAPRRCARGRAGETLVLALDATWMPLGDSQAQHLCDLAARAYFDTPGSVTAALRASFTAVNDEVFQGTEEWVGVLGPQAQPIQINLATAVLHEEALFLGFAGEVLILVASHGFLEGFPTQGEKPGQPLGASRTAELHYGHISLQPAHDSEPFPTLLLSGLPAAAWRNALDNASRLSLHAIAERMSQAPTDANRDLAAILVRLVPEAAAARAAPERSAVLPRISLSSLGDGKPAVARESLGELGLPGMTPELSPKREAPGVAGAAPLSTRMEEPASGGNQGAKLRSPARRDPRAGSSTRVSEPGLPLEGLVPERQQGEEATELNLVSGLRSFARATRVSFEAGWAVLSAGLRRLTPEGPLPKEGSFSLPSRAMLATAIVVPLVVVAMVGVLYYQRGRAEKFALVLGQAQSSAQAAAGQSDPSLARQQWTRVLALVDETSQYGESAELETIRTQGTHALDVLDGITALNFQPLVPNGLGAGTRITSLVIGDEEIFALDADRGQVLRLVMAQGGYQVDDSFNCQAGNYPEQSVATPVDIAWVPDITVGSQVPSSAQSGVLVAVDAKGGVLYCPPGGTAAAGALIPPRTGWLSLQAIDYYDGSLYALDPTANGFWRYPTNGFNFDQPPEDYFNAAVPNITDAIDFVVAGGDVFFLHADGHLTRCTYNPLLPLPGNAGTGANVCTDIPYHDTRPGRQAGPRIVDAQFTQLRYDPPPEPSLFFLDSFGRGAFRFSLALDFLAHYRVTAAPPGDATALAVGPDKTLYLAIGDQIYSAQTALP